MKQLHQDLAAKETELEAAATHVRRMTHQEQRLQEDLTSCKVCRRPLRQPAAAGTMLSQLLPLRIKAGSFEHAQLLKQQLGMQEQLAGTSLKLEEAKEQIQGSENMIRWLNLQVCWTPQHCVSLAADVCTMSVVLAALSICHASSK